MNLYQIKDSDGEIIGLFNHEQDKDLTPTIKECEQTAFDACENDLELNIIDEFISELEYEGFTRIFVEPINTDL